MLADILGVELLALVKWVFLVLDGFLDCKRRPLADFEVEVLRVLPEGFGVDSGQVDFALVLFGNGLELFRELLTFVGVLSEDVGEWDFGLRMS